MFAKSAGRADELLPDRTSSFEAYVEDVEGGLFAEEFLEIISARIVDEDRIAMEPASNLGDFIGFYLDAIRPRPSMRGRSASRGSPQRKSCLS